MLTFLNRFSSFAPATARVGRLGEDVAVRHLRRLGYRIIGRNLRVGRGEVDVLAVDPQDGVLVFAEVKARTGRMYDPSLNLTPVKRQRMAAAARHWVQEKQVDLGYRLDLVTVAEGDVVDHWKEIEWC